MASSEIKYHFPVFVSSTYEDLVSYRDAAQRVLTRLEQTVKGMEYFGADARKPLDVCLSDVRACKVYVGIIGMRYGSIDEVTGKSYTQLEYEEAIKNKIPTLIYMIDSNECLVLPKFVDTGERGEKLMVFKNSLKANHTISFFTSKDDFAAKLTQDLAALLSDLGHSNEVKEVKQDMQTKFEETFEKFTFRPAKYIGQEGLLTVKVSHEDKVCSSIKTNFITAIGMIQGDTVGVSVYVLNHKTGEFLPSGRIRMYGDRECGDWIEAVPTDTVVTVKVRLNYVVIHEVEEYDSGSILKDFNYKSLILLAVPQADK